MGYTDQVRFVLTVGSIVGLLVIGIIVAARSGVVSTSRPEGVRLFLGNLSAVFIRIFGYLIGLAAVQEFIGFPIGFIW
jgi:hypothetical protein